MATSKGVRYSDGKSDTTGRLRNFPWEYPVPDNKFWNDLPFTVGRNFLSNYSEEEIKQLPIDPDSALGKDKKLELLDELLHTRLASQDAAAAPETFYDVDYVSWDRLWLGIFTMQYELGRPGAEQVMRMMCDRRKDKSNLSHFHTLAGLLLARGEYTEAEKMENDVKVWLEEKLGKDSPQVLGARRIIVQAVWKQGVSRRDYAENLLEEIKEIIEGMGSGPFGVYQEQERELFNKMKESLERG
ncbi:hypothetical protein F5884DRAFT_101736 [Xylogone sp. PMI_703]|nr:hypothetical protein F5884DRAFT_101736 [Xylogone sp. PMI_703]